MSDFDFGKQFRLLSRSDFEGLKAGCARIKTRGILAYYRDTANPGKETRIGISVSKKVGNAITRNRIKRCIREMFRNSNSKFLNIDILFVVLPSLTKQFVDGNFEEILFDGLRFVFDKLGRKV